MGVSSGSVTENLEGRLPVLQNTVHGGSSASDIIHGSHLKVLKNSWKVL